MERARGAGHRGGPLRPGGASPAVHARALRLRGRHVPGRRGRVLADARASVLPAARGRRPGARGRACGRCHDQRATPKPSDPCGGPGGRERVESPPGEIRGGSSSGLTVIRMADGGRMIFLGFGKYARADKIYAVEPIVGKERGGGHRTRVWIEGVPDPIIAGRTERTILHDMGQDAAMGAPIIDEALKLAERIVERRRQGPRRPERPRPAGSPPAREDVTPRRGRKALLTDDRPPASRRRRRAAACSRAIAVDIRPLRESRDFRRLWFGTGHLGDREPDHDGRDSVPGLRADGSTLARRPARDRRARPAADRPALRRGGRGRRRPPAAAALLGRRAARGHGRAARERAARQTRESGRSTSREALGTAAYASSGPRGMRSTPRLVGEDELLAAIAVEDVVFTLARVVGPALGGRPDRRRRAPGAYGSTSRRSPPRCSRSGCCPRCRPPRRGSAEPAVDPRGLPVRAAASRCCSASSSSTRTR